MPLSETFRIYGTITHNFLQSRLANFLHLPSTPTSMMRVMISDCTMLDCTSMCLNIPVTIQRHTFPVDLYPLPIGGTNIVLGVQWLKLLGPVTIDHSALTMSFSYLGHNITLQADVPLYPSPASAQQLKRYAQTHSISPLYQITHIPDPITPQSSSTPQHDLHTPPSLDNLLHRFASLFHEPHQLPPSRNITHHIHLLPNSSPINVKPYRYPYS